MSITEAQNNLGFLVANSPSLSSENKELIKNSLDTLNEEQVNSLMLLFTKEKEELAAIDNTYERNALPLKTQYLKIIKEFNHDGVKRAMKKWENLNSQTEEQNLQNLLQELKQQNTQPDQKSKNRGGLHGAMLKLLVATGLIALLIGAYFLLINIAAKPKIVNNSKPIPSIE